MAKLTPINKSYPVLEGDTNFFSGQTLRWLNDLQTNTTSLFTAVNSDISAVEGDITSINDELAVISGENVFFVDNITELADAFSFDTGDVLESKTIYINKDILIDEVDRVFRIFNVNTYVFGGSLTNKKKLTFKKYIDNNTTPNVYMYNEFVSSDGLEANSYDGTYDLEGLYLRIVNYKYYGTTTSPYQGLGSTIRYCRGFEGPTLGLFNVLCEDWTGCNPEEQWNNGSVSRSRYFLPPNLDSANYKYDFHEGYEQGNCKMTSLGTDTTTYDCTNTYYIGGGVWTLIDSSYSARIETNTDSNSVPTTRISHILAGTANDNYLNSAYIVFERDKYGNTAEGKGASILSNLDTTNWQYKFLPGYMVIQTSRTSIATITSINCYITTLTGTWRTIITDSASIYTRYSETSFDRVSNGVFAPTATPTFTITRENDAKGNTAVGEATITGEEHPNYTYEFVGYNTVKMGNKTGNGYYICSNVIYTATGWKFLSAGYGSISYFSNGNTATSYTTNQGTGYLSGPTPAFSEILSMEVDGARYYSGATPLASLDSSYSYDIYKGGRVVHTHKTTGVKIEAINAYISGGAWKAIATGTCSLYVQTSDYHAWYTAPTTSAGATVTWEVKLLVYHNGNVLHNGASLPTGTLRSGYTYEVWPDKTILHSATNGETQTLSNCTYYDGAYRYLSTGEAVSLHIQNINGHYWYGKGGSFAGGVISWDSLMTIEHSGTFAGRLQLKSGTTISYNL